MQRYATRTEASFATRIVHAVEVGGARPTGASLDRLTRRVHILEMDAERQLECAFRRRYPGFRPASEGAALPAAA